VARVVVSARLPDPGAVERLRAAGHEVLLRDDTRPAGPDELLRLTEGREGLLAMPVDRVDAALLDARPQLRFVANFGVGYDNVDVDAATSRGVMVTNTPGVLSDAVADHCVALVLAAARRVVEGDRLMRRGGWTGFSTDLLLGMDLAGATAGLVGLGGVGAAVARRLVSGFGMRGLYVGRRPRPELERELALERVELPDLLARADVVTLHLPLTAETRGLIGARELAAMRDGAVLVNVARGPIVDEAALVAALREGRIRAGLDVFDEEPLPPGHPLLDLETAVLTPHVASAGRRSRAAMAALAADNLLEMLAGRRPPNVVNPQALRTPA
jgi:glyoxylate reductase